MLVTSGLYTVHRTLAHLHPAFPLRRADTGRLKQPATRAGNLLHHRAAVQTHPLHLHGLNLNRHAVELIHPAAHLDGCDTGGPQDL